MATLKANPTPVHADATAYLTFQGPPNVTVEWVVDGSGAISQSADYTNAQGLAYAIFTPSTPNTTVTITVNHGT